MTDETFSGKNKSTKTSVSSPSYAKLSNYDLLKMLATSQLQFNFPDRNKI